MMSIGAVAPRNFLDIPPDIAPSKNEAIPGLVKRPGGDGDAYKILTDMLLSADEDMSALAAQLQGLSGQAKGAMQDAKFQKAQKKMAQFVQKKQQEATKKGGMFGKLMKFVKIATIIASVAGAAFTGGASLAVGLAVAGAMMSLAAKPLSKALGLGKAGEIGFSIAGAALSMGAGSGTALSNASGALGKTGEVGAQVAQKCADAAKFLEKLNPDSYLQQLGLNNFIGQGLQQLGLDSSLQHLVGGDDMSSLLTSGLGQLGVNNPLSNALVRDLVNDGLKKALGQSPTDFVAQKLGVPNFTDVTPEEIAKGLVQQGAQGWLNEVSSMQHGLGELSQSLGDFGNSLRGADMPGTVPITGNDITGYLAGIKG